MKVVVRSTTPVAEEFSNKFQLPSKPADSIPEMPGSLGELSDFLLMQLYSEFVAWVSYAKAELVKAEISEDRTAHLLKVAEATAIIGQWSDKAKGDTVTLAKARRDCSPEVVAAQEEHLEARAVRKLTESVFDRCERSAQVLSRELSRRISIAPMENRNARYTP